MIRSLGAAQRNVRFLWAGTFCVLVSLAVVFVLFSVTTLRSGTVTDHISTLTVKPLVSPAGANSRESQMTSGGDQVILSWIETSGQHATLKYASRNSQGWVDPKTVVSGDNFFINSSDVPSVLATAGGTLVAQWLQRNAGEDPDSDAYNVRLSWSSDHGRTWSRPSSPHHDGTKTQHGFVSLFPTAGAGLGLVWLDGRATNPETESGDMALRASLYGPDGKQLREMVVSSRVCDCCSTATAETSEGVIVAFRNRSSNEVRDIYVSRFADGQWSVPIPVHNDGWRIEACPINGPSISAHGRDVAVAWFTAKNNQGQAFVAFSHDAGRTFGSPFRVDDVASRGRLGVQLLEDGSAAVAWIEFAGQHSQLRVRTIAPSGARSAPVTLSQASVDGFPRLARSGDQLVSSWTETDQGSPRVRTALLSLGEK